MSQAITVVSNQGDLSPTQSGKLKGKLNKSKKPNESDNTAIQAASRQSKKTIVKNPKYL